MIAVGFGPTCGTFALHQEISISLGFILPNKWDVHIRCDSYFEACGVGVCVNVYEKGGACNHVCICIWFYFLVQSFFSVLASPISSKFLYQESRARSPSHHQFNEHVVRRQSEKFEKKFPISGLYTKTSWEHSFMIEQDSCEQTLFFMPT